MTAAAVGTFGTQLQGAGAGVAAEVIAFLEDSEMQQSLQGRCSRQEQARALKCEADANLFSYITCKQSNSLPSTICS